MRTTSLWLVAFSMVLMIGSESRSVQAVYFSSFVFTLGLVLAVWGDVRELRDRPRGNW